MDPEGAFVLLALDPAKSVSGAGCLCVQSSGALRVVFHARVTTQIERAEVVRKACAFCFEHALPLVVVAEEWDPPRHRRPKPTAPGEASHSGFDEKWNYKTILGMGEGWGKWTAELERNAVRRVVRVTPNAWRNALFGKKRPKSADELKKLGQLYVHGRLNLRLEDDNVAEALCIGLWGAIAPEVLESARKERKILNTQK